MHLGLRALDRIVDRLHVYAISIRHQCWDCKRLEVEARLLQGFCSKRHFRWAEGTFLFNESTHCKPMGPFVSEIQFLSKYV